MVLYVAASRDRSERYWNSLAQSASSRFDFPLWRHYCDELHAQWLHQRLPPSRVHKALKTDLFDEACGEGLAECLLALPLPGGECHGFDVSSVIVERAAMRHPRLRTHCCDVRRLPFAENQFDLVISNSTLDHFHRKHDLLTSLKQLHRVITPGGLLAITLDNSHHPLLALRNGFCGPFMGGGVVLPYFVGHTMGLRELSKELRALGFEVLTCGHLMHAPRLVALHLSRLLPSQGAAARWFLRVLLALESMAMLPTAPITGHFVAVVARKLPDPSAAGN